MKKLSILLLAIPLLTSCVPTGVIGIKGKYQEGPVRMKMDLPVEVVWGRVIDLIADEGLNVRIIEKASGLVISDPVSFIDSYSPEDKTGVLINKSAHIVTTRMNDGTIARVMSSVNASWNLRVKETGAGKSTVSVLLYNINAKGIVDDYRHKGKSTGNFEKWLLQNLFDRK